MKFPPIGTPLADFEASLKETKETKDELGSESDAKTKDEL